MNDVTITGHTVNSRGYREYIPRECDKSENTQYKMIKAIVEVMILLRDGQWVKAEEITNICKKHRVFKQNLIDNIPLAHSDKGNYYCLPNEKTPLEPK